MSLFSFSEVCNKQAELGKWKANRVERKLVRGISDCYLTAATQSEASQKDFSSTDVFRSMSYQKLTPSPD